jgi:hypothetical protein
MKNPFGLLSVRRDDEEEAFQPSLEKDIDPITHGPLAEQQRMKRKIRPEEKRTLEEEKNQTKKGMEEEGFTEIRKNKKPTAVDAAIYEENVLKENQKEKNFKVRNPPLRGGKRTFDRHSGTGRGKEISKRGAGGKTTWGDPQQYAEKEAVDYLDEVEHRQEEERCKHKIINHLDFQTALHPETQPETIKIEGVKPPEYTELTKVREGKKGPEPEQPISEEAIARKQEETGDFHKLDSKKEQKRRKKSLNVEEKPEVETGTVIEQIENTITYAEYLEQLKKKNEQLFKDKEKNIQKPSPPQTGLSVETAQRTKDHKEYEQWVESLHQKKKKPKEKKSDSTEDEINKLIGQKMILGPEKRLYAPASDKEKESYTGKFARPTKSQTDFPEL